MMGYMCIGSIIISVIGSPNAIEISEVSANHIAKLVRIEGQVSQYDNENQLKVLEISSECAMDHVFITGVDIIAKPKR
jgi:DNA replicative helicase MCM subunit Mcm2 (Cdc46/Mcm family)